MVHYEKRNKIPGIKMEDYIYHCSGDQHDYDTHLRADSRIHQKLDKSRSAEFPKYCRLRCIRKGDRCTGWNMDHTAGRNHSHAGSDFDCQRHGHWQPDEDT